MTESQYEQHIKRMREPCVMLYYGLILLFYLFIWLTMLCNKVYNNIV